jgi:hypothetical protein
MSNCTSMRPLIDRVSEGEATPEEALALGRHLPACTVCRILLAKAHRLNEMVDGIGDPLEVDESFLQGVMDSLPDGPPQSADQAGTRRSGRHLRIVKFLVTMSPLGLLGAGRSMVMGYPGAFTRIVDGGTILPAEGAPGITGSVREILGLAFALAGKLGITGGDLTSVRPMVAMGNFVSQAWPLTLALMATAALALVVYRPLRKIFSRHVP